MLSIIVDRRDNPHCRKIAPSAPFAATSVTAAATDRTYAMYLAGVHGAVIDLAQRPSSVTASDAAEIGRSHLTGDHHRKRGT